ncbi:MAG: lmo0937 family membrane protein [Candidatus Daviesbacteria bacterium]|nr:lmo0937 family membrane protein [Candidatus Daviesbacteria bacterium]
MLGLIELILIILVISWLGGFAFNFGGDLIHILLVLAVIVFIFRYLRSRHHV